MASIQNYVKPNMQTTSADLICVPQGLHSIHPTSCVRGIGRVSKQTSDAIQKYQGTREAEVREYTVLLHDSMTWPEHVTQFPMHSGSSCQYIVTAKWFGRDKYAPKQDGHESLVKMRVNTNASTPRVCYGKDNWRKVIIGKWTSHTRTGNYCLWVCVYGST